MANATLTKGTGTPVKANGSNATFDDGTNFSVFKTSASTTLTLYGTQSDDGDINSNFVPTPLPGTSSSDTIVTDLLGTNGNFNLSGIFVEESSPGTVTASNFIMDLRALCFGKQGNTGGSQVGYTFTPTYHSSTTYRVYVNSIAYQTAAGSPTRVAYTISLMHASGSSV